MKLLAIDTASAACSAAVCVGTREYVRYEIAPRQHASLILPMIDGLLAEAAVSLDELDAIAYGCGPGSFTGVRIAVGVTQGMATGAGVDTVAVSNLEMLAIGAVRRNAATRIATLVDARMNELYAGFFVFENDTLERIGDESVTAPGDVELPDGDDWHIAGDGWLAYPEIREHFAHRLAGSSELLRYPEARDALPPARAILRAGGGRAPEHASPVYLRDRM